MTADDGTGFEWQTEEFADVRVLRYQVKGWEQLDLARKRLAYYLYQAALSGRDIIYDQNFAGNLRVRRTLEAILRHQAQNEQVDGDLLCYLKRVWFSNGIHHHYGARKLVPAFDESQFRSWVGETPAEELPLLAGEHQGDLCRELIPILFDPELHPKRIVKDQGVDVVQASSCNFYEGVTQLEVEAFYEELEDPNDSEPVSHGLNSKLVKRQGEVRELVWHRAGMYGEAIAKIVHWLELARDEAETEEQREALTHLIEYYVTGDLAAFDRYSIAWVRDTKSEVDAVNGFIEVYGDPLGYRGTFESIVSIRDQEASRRIEAISRNAQWFEDHSPILPEHKKKNVVGISAKVIEAVVQAGDSSPTGPIGVNLPNASWIRKKHGSKSVSLSNIVHAYDESSKNSGYLEEFCWDAVEGARAKRFGTLASNLETDLHEVIGHASGQKEPHVGSSKETLKSYASTIEETRADLVALYYIADPKLQELGLVSGDEVMKAAYDAYFRNGLLWQLRRIEPGEQVEEDHMRNRQLICNWARALPGGSRVVEKRTRDHSTYFCVTDYDALRQLFAQQLREIQRITSQGDFEAARQLVETHGVQVDRELHAEVLRRNERLGIPPYAGFLNPRLDPVRGPDGSIVDVRIDYPADFQAQQLEYSRNYSFLPHVNG